MPMVSVVVIGYNDATHLPAAVRSVMRQTFRDVEIIVVDDASTDDTPAVTSALAAEDPRIKVLRLDENSGGCSRPRNAGVAAASGRYVAFLDSDDQLPRRSIARLVAAAERAGADLTCGRWVRRHHHPRRVLTAHDELYLRPCVIDSILQCPRLLYDTPAWNKLYRRSFIVDNALQFPEGLLYEDLLFTTEAYCLARRIAIVPDLVYVWHVRRDADEPSITNRGDVRVWRDRFEVHRRIDAFLTSHKVGQELVSAKQRKFFDADFVVYLRELRQAWPAVRGQLVGLAADYVCALDMSAYDALPPAIRRAVQCLGSHDLEGTLDAADWAVTGNALLATVTAVAATGGQVSLTGELHAADGTSVPVGDARLQLRSRLGGALGTVPARLDASADGRVTFRADLDLAKFGRSILSPRAGPETRFALCVGAREVTLSARDADLPTTPIVVSTPWRAVTGSSVRLVERNGRFVAVPADAPASMDRLVEAATRVRNSVHRLRLRLLGPR